MKKTVTYELETDQWRFEFETPMCQLSVWKDDHLEALFDLEVHEMNLLAKFFADILEELRHD